MPPTGNEPKVVIVICPECDTETRLERDEDGELQGRCPNAECRLDVGRVMTKRRYERALQRQVEREEEASGRPKKNRSSWNPFD